MCPLQEGKHLRVGHPPLSCLIRFTVLGKIPHRKAALVSYQLQLMLYGFSQCHHKAVLPAQSELAEPEVVPPDLVQEELDSLVGLTPVPAGANGSNGPK